MCVCVSHSQTYINSVCAHTYTKITPKQIDRYKKDVQTNTDTYMYMCIYNGKGFAIERPKTKTDRLSFVYIILCIKNVMCLIWFCK